MPSERVYSDPDLGPVTLRKSVRARRIILRVHPVRGVTVSMPYFISYQTGINFLLTKKDWVQKALARRRPAARLTEEEAAALRRQAKAYLPARLKALAAEHGFVYHQVRIKHNSSNWGSCSAKGNINLNLNLMRLPVELSDYVLLHELCHLKHPDHSPQFHALLESVCPDHRRKERQIRQYPLL